MEWSVMEMSLTPSGGSSGLQHDYFVAGSLCLLCDSNFFIIDPKHGKLIRKIDLQQEFSVTAMERSLLVAEGVAIVVCRNEEKSTLKHTIHTLTSHTNPLQNGRPRTGCFCLWLFEALLSFQKCSRLSFVDSSTYSTLVWCQIPCLRSSSWSGARSSRLRLLLWREHNRRGDCIWCRTFNVFILQSIRR